MDSILTHKFSRRELVLFLILVLVLLVGLYFYLVHYPIVTRLDEIEQEREDVALSTQIAQLKYENYKSMKSELDEIFSMPEDEITVMPEYDNIQTLMVYFNHIFAGTDPTLNYDTVRFDGNIATRTVRFTFNADSYTQAKTILRQLTGTGYRCLMENVSLTPAEAQGEVEKGALKVTGTITFYELATDIDTEESKA